ncbi:MAG: hypothetical protein JOZ87_41070 [Chloroflexi bacterium]|nr:hypothetical protein [Chloroflexota bacterium]
MYLVDQPPKGTFTTPELARLAAYRAAVAAGFYTDWDGSASTTDTQELAWLSGTNYPFTTDERQRLDRLRADLAEGHYADDQPPAALAPEATPEPAAPETTPEAPAPGAPPDDLAR